jgi:RNase P protein component
VFKQLRDERPELDLLLLVREDIRNQTRRDIRKTLQKLMTRGAEGMQRERPAQGDAGG